MKKYLAAVKTEWQRQMTYRINFFAFRIGSVFEILAQVIIWTAIYKNVDLISGYNFKEMMTYVVVGWLFYFLTANYNFENIIADNIKTGNLSNFITKPIDYIRYNIVLSFGRISIALATAVAIQFILILIFRDKLIFIFDIKTWLVIILMLLLGYMIKLFISMLSGFIAFWTTEISGIYYGVNILVKFFSGAYFPINLLPLKFVTLSSFFPFIYTLYYPVQLYMGKISVAEGLKGLGIEIIWLFVLYAIIKIVWKKGLKKYESVGI